MFDWQPKYLWRKVFRRSAKSLGCVAPSDVLLAEAEIGNLYVTVFVEQ